MGYGVHRWEGQQSKQGCPALPAVAGDPGHDAVLGPGGDAESPHSGQEPPQMWPADLSYARCGAAATAGPSGISGSKLKPGLELI